MKVYLIGASGHAKVILEILEAQEIEVGGLVDDNSLIHYLLEYPVEQELGAFFILKEYKVIISIGNNATRKRIASNYPYKYATAIHPKSNISSRATVGEGTVIMAGVSINSEVKIGMHSIINTNASIDHDCVLEDYVHISPNVALAGNVEVGEGTHIGIGACIIQGVKIGKWCTIGAGAVIIKDIPDGCTVVGNPGKIIKSATDPIRH